jgi:nucleotide-binding universal stress UspA family protein
MNAELTIVDLLPDVPEKARRFVTDRIEQELVDHRWDLLKAIAERRGGRARTAVLRGPAPAVSLIREVMRGGHDLLIRAHGTVNEEAGPFGPIDLQLLRKCPCPVWLVGPSGHPRPRRILAAIDAGCNDPGEAELNQAILNAALTIRDLEGSHVTVLYAWSAFGFDLLQWRMPAKEFEVFVESARAAAAEDLNRFIADLGPRRPDVDTLLVEGEPHTSLLDYAGSHVVDLVVMGTVARTGLAGFVMGNTAERILRQLRGSVLAIKPAGFVSPITPA